MTGFSADWLALREGADHRSRNSALAHRLSAHFGLRETINIVDLGSGTGSNLRATYALLPATQFWTLVDHDAGLLARARETLVAWADHADVKDNAILLDKDGKSLVVDFKPGDLTTDLETVLPVNADLVTASALFDLVSPRFMQQLAKLGGSRGAVLYAVLTYNGQQTWTPRHPLDNEMRGAFHAHQITDKGFGVTAGPIAASELIDALAMAGFSVSEGTSDWVLENKDTPLIAALSEGYAEAVGETGMVGADDIARWQRVKRTGAVVGHTDTLAFPPSGTFDDEPDDDEAE